ncbi:Clan CA, family C19, ubiquitin hydrolase-like cysteine peptidase [Histomonas meleagridis]|uniref:Clan CA, family C19, ubiquitin hydrolase-like cysteine peptidase n=1 Tax=Histomonas meleagridis TaxID=135588 RepID=UPI00355A98E6|nr:Clan CA, family C19, ubiquitin hydrolase-like cysteine peptidase [Histomonas meleagridis]KAH0801590.1 Clan CA, family C19, ubiquitin hydrolase-like cysteine peptidase [Histomonas meleagridis]
MKKDGYPSPVYSISDKKWRMVIFPQGYRIKDYLSIFILCPKINEEHRVTIQVDAIGGKKERSQTAEFTYSKLVTNRGFSSFIPLNELDDYTVDNHLVLKLTVTFNPPHSNAINYRKLTGAVGLVNQGCTCYMNSILQCLFHTPAFRRIVFSLPTSDKDDPKSSVSLNLQRLFALMQLSPIAPETADLTKSFGWGTIEVFMQHDVQEFLRQLIDNIETKMKGTENSEAIATIFRGKTKNYIKCATQEDISNEHLEDFYDIQLLVQGMKGLESSLEQTVEDSILTGDNQYSFEGIGKCDAIKGCKYEVLPPVLHFHLQRFTYDINTGMMRKVRDRFEFPFEVDMSPYLSETADRTNPYIYELTSVLVHQGEQYGGHYYAYCRPTKERKWLCFNDDVVSVVDEKEVIEGNYGGLKQGYSAYFLAYVRKSQIENIMKPINDNEIPEHVVDYYNEWKSIHSARPPSITLRFITNDEYIKQIEKNGYIMNVPETDKKIVCPADLKFSDFISEVKKNSGVDSKDISLWRVMSDGFPIDRISTNLQVKSVFKFSSKLFVGEAPEHVKGEIPIILMSYDPNDFNNHLKYIKFIVLKQTDTIKALEIPNADELIFYHYSNNKIKEISLNKTLLDQNIRKGAIIYQKKYVTLDKFNNNKQNLYYYFDILPEYRIKTADKYIESLQNSIIISTTSLDDLDNVHYKLNVLVKMPIKSLIKCFRIMLNLSESDSILLFQKEGCKGPSNHPLIINGNIEQLITNRFVYYQIMKNVSQKEIETKVFFKVSILNENLELIQNVSLLMDHGFNVNDVMTKLKSKNIINENDKYRFVQLLGSRIIKVLENDTKLENLTSSTFRIEVIPNEQIDTKKLIRVTLTTNKTIPKNSCVGVPFFLNIIENEKFADTKNRIAKFAKVDISKTCFGYTNESRNLKNFKMLSDDNVLSELINGDDTMLYVFVPGAVAVKQRTHEFSWNAGVKIYN